MAENGMVKRLETMSRFLLVLAGADLASVAWTVSKPPTRVVRPSLGWYVACVVLSVATAVPAAGGVLAWDLRRIALDQRLGTAFGSLALEWLVQIALCLNLPLSLGEALTSEGVIGVGSGAWCLYARSRARREREEPERIFPLRGDLLWVQCIEQAGTEEEDPGGKAAQRHRDEPPGQPKSGIAQMEPTRMAGSAPWSRSYESACTSRYACGGTAHKRRRCSHVSF